MVLSQKGLIEKFLSTGMPLDNFLEYQGTPAHVEGKVVSNIFDYNKETYYETLGEDHYFQFGFKNMSFTIVAYKITSCFNTRASHLKSWHFYGSNDKENWTLLHYVPNDSQLNGPFYSAVYRVPRPKGPFKYYLFDNVTTYYIQDKILLADFDVFDSIFSLFSYSCKRLYFPRKYHLFMLFALL